MEQITSPGSDLHLTFLQRFFLIFLRAFFNLLYHQFAWAYDWIASIVSLGDWLIWVKSVLPYIDGPKVLEIGFGPGHLQLSLHQKGISVVGIDESPQMVKLTQRRINRSGFNPSLVSGNAYILPFSDGSFNQIVMTFPADFIFNQQTLTEIHRVLVKGGKAIILPLAWITGRRPMQRVAAWFNHVTGEAPDWNEKYLEPLEQLGFIVGYEMIDFTDSKVIIIQLIKPLTFQ
jgi:ubiquinone/menaquinone biosynthesis C-methylase UbiE